MMLRLQRERMNGLVRAVHPGIRHYFSVSTRRSWSYAKPDALVMHPA